MLELGTLHSDNSRNVCNLNELNDAKFKGKLMLIIHVESWKSLSFGLSLGKL